MRDDLAFMIERADTMANRLENAVRSARNEVRSPPQPGAAPRPGGKAAQQATAAVAAAAAVAEIDIDERSEAERELLRALQSMR